MLLGYTFFWMMQMEHFEMSWRCDPRGEGEYTQMHLRNPITDGLREYGLHLPTGGGVTSSFKGTLYELWKCQTVDAQWYQEKNTWEFSWRCRW